MSDERAIIVRKTKKRPLKRQKTKDGVETNEIRRGKRKLSRREGNI